MKTMMAVVLVGFAAISGSPLVSIVALSVAALVLSKAWSFPTRGDALVTSGLVVLIVAILVGLAQAGAGGY